MYLSSPEEDRSVVKGEAKEPGLFEVWWEAMPALKPEGEQQHMICIITGLVPGARAGA